MLRNIAIMKTFSLFLLLFSLTGCHKSEVDPESEEVRVTILNHFVGFAACSGGYILQMEHDAFYRTLTLPEPYNDASKVKLPALVWIRYKNPTGSCSQTQGLIDVTTIRPN